MERENYYLLLELSIDPPVTDPGEIRAALTRKKQEWTRWQDHPGKRTPGLANLASLPDIEQVMFDPASRKAEARKALALRGDMLRRYEAELRILEAKGHLLPREVTAIAAKYKVFGIDNHKVRELARVPVADQPPAPREREDTGEVIDRMTAKTIVRNLAMLDKPDLYAFLGEPPYSSIKKLRSAAEARRRSAATGGKTALSVAAQELSGLCMRLFDSFDSKQLYDRYLKISAFPAVGEMIDEEFTRARHISPSALMRLVNFAVETYHCKVLDAEDYIRRYCFCYKIPVGTETPLITCPACRGQAEPESVVCQFCAAPLRGSCPVCGTPFEKGAAACGACGFLLVDMVKALPYLDAARGAIIDRSWSVALRSLAHLEKYWPGHPEIAPLKSRARGLEERYAWYVDQVNDCIKNSRYYAALELVQDAEENRVKLPASTVRQINKVVDDLERQLEALAMESSPNIERLIELSGTVSDSIELSRLLGRHPPRAPGYLRAEVEGRQVHLSWGVGGSPGRAEYVLVRKQGCAPFTAFDGDILYEGPANSYCDHSARALKEHYYRVFSRRGNIYSPDGAQFGPVVLIPEIEGLRILPADQGAQISWAVNTDMREVRIWRKLGGERPSAPGEGVLIETTRIDGFVDSKIKNDVEYWYYLVAVYSMNGKEVLSSGVCDMITPHKVMAPVERLNIVKADYGTDEFAINWHAEDFSGLVLLASPKKPDFRAGDIIPMQELLGRYRRLSLHVRSSDSGRFRYSFVGGAYIFAAVPFGRFGVVGTPYYLTNLREIEDPVVNAQGNDLHLKMRWPMGLAEIAVAWRSDRFPREPDELGTSVTRVSREQYYHDGGITLPEVGTGVFYLKIFALFTDHDGVAMVSDGVELLFKNMPRQELFYRFAYKRKRLASKAELVLTVSGPQAFTLPKMVITSLAGRLPLSAEDGTDIFKLNQELRVDGEVQFKYDIAPFPEGVHLRLFLQDNAQYERFRLLPASELRMS